MNILAIDTSCDETSAAVVQDDHIVANIISSQVELHTPFGGVVPMIAKRAHEERIDPVIQKALKRAHLTLKHIDVFAVTYGPGLAIALEVGVRRAKELAQEYGKPLIAVNHMEGHIYAMFADVKKVLPHLPLLALLVSGGHTELVLMKNHGVYELIGQTVDDAAGEAFDKVARMLGLGYPGGALLAKLAEEGNPRAYSFTIPMTRTGDLNFSFSGIKTAVMRLMKELSHDGTRVLAKKEIMDIAASFQHISVEHVVRKTVTAVERTHVQTVIIGGGVSANLLLRKTLRARLKPLGVSVLYPTDKKLCMDNAAMIGVVAYYKAQRKEFVQNIEKLDRNPVTEITD